jgi:hypothetical protein
VFLCFSGANLKFQNVRFAFGDCGRGPPSFEACVLQAAVRLAAAYLLHAIRAVIGDCESFVRPGPTSTLPLPRPVPLQTKFQEKKRYETTVILIDDSAALLDNRKKLTKWTNDFTDARNWLIRELDSLHG